MIRRSDVARPSNGEMMKKKRSSKKKKNVPKKYTNDKSIESGEEYKSQQIKYEAE